MYYFCSYVFIQRSVSRTKNLFFLNLARKINFAKLVVALVVWTKKQCISIVRRLIYLCIDWMESKHKSAHLHLTYSSGSISNWNESDTPGGKYDHWSIFTQKTKHMYKKNSSFQSEWEKNWLFIQIICWQTVCKQQTKQNKNLTDWIDKTIHYAVTMVLISKLVVYIVCLLWMILIIGCKWASLISVVNVHSIETI